MINIVNCPKCKRLTHINISHAIDVEGEVFICEYCKYPFRFVKK